MNIPVDENGMVHFKTCLFAMCREALSIYMVDGAVVMYAKLSPVHVLLQSTHKRQQTMSYTNCSGPTGRNMLKIALSTCVCLKKTNSRAWR